jgi:competence protein ComEA
MSKNIDLNIATEQELSGIQGFGHDNAKKIIDYRKLHGPFKNWEDLKHIPGLLGNMVDTLKRHGCKVAGKAA